MQQRPAATQRRLNGRLTLLSPHLAARPLVGSSCCVVPAADLVTDELQSWPHVRVLELDPDAGKIVVHAGANAPTRDDLLDGLAAIGYPATPESTDAGGC